jgi:hypothetical protein
LLKTARSVGRPLPEIVVEIVGDDGVRVASGTEGRIRIRVPQVSGRYAAGQESAADGNGWLLTERADAGRLLNACRWTG